MMTYDPRFAGDRPPCTSPIVDKSLLVMILPGMEQGTLYNAINQSTTIFGLENRTAQVVTVGVYACPSDPSSGAPRRLVSTIFQDYGLAADGEEIQAVFTSYSGCYGSLFVDALPRRPTCTIPPALRRQADGCFNDLSPIAFSGITDGLSSTLLVVEKATTTFRGPVGIPDNTYDDYGWYFSGNWGDTLATSFYPMNARKVVAAGSIFARVFSSSSLHPGGVNALFGDGSVRFLKDSIDSWPFDVYTGRPQGITSAAEGWWENIPRKGVWQAISTRNDGEILSADAY